MSAADKQKHRIIMATMTLIAERGAADVSMAAIAEAAEISRQTLYNHFPDVAAVAEASLLAHAAAMQDHLRALVAEAPSPAEAVATIARFMVEAVGAGHATLNLDPVLSADARARLAPAEAMPRTILTEVLAQAGGHDDPAMGDLAWSMIEAGAGAAARHPEAAPRLTETLISALQAAHIARAAG